jgi:hypothetical protein
VNLGLNELLLELVTFNDYDPLKESSFTPADADLGLDIEVNGGESCGNSGDLDDFDMEGYD